MRLHGLYAHGQNAGRWSTQEQESRRHNKEGGAGQDICWKPAKRGHGEGFRVSLLANCRISLPLGTKPTSSYSRPPTLPRLPTAHEKSCWSCCKRILHYGHNCVDAVAAQGNEKWKRRGDEETRLGQEYPPYRSGSRRWHCWEPLHPSTPPWASRTAPS